MNFLYFKKNTIIWIENHIFIVGHSSHKFYNFTYLCQVSYLLGWVVHPSTLICFQEFAPVYCFFWGSHWLFLIRQIIILGSNFQPPLSMKMGRLQYLFNGSMVCNFGLKCLGNHWLFIIYNLTSSMVIPRTRIVT